MPNLYFYKLIVDDGGAPCVENGLLSLAICKPMIRSTACIDDIVIGFAANSLHSDNRLIYVARVTKKLANGDYYKLPQYGKRADCIYEWKKNRFAPRPGSVYHGSSGDLSHDLGAHPRYQRANTLLSRDFCYFGAAGSDGYKRRYPAIKKAVAALGRGHRVFHNQLLLAELSAFCKQICPLDGAGVMGSPTTGPRRCLTHRGSGCGIATARSVIRPCQ